MNSLLSSTKKGASIVSKEKKKNLLLSEYVKKNTTKKTLFPSDGFYLTPIDVVLPVLAVYKALKEPQDIAYISDVANEYILGSFKRRYPKELLDQINNLINREELKQEALSLIGRTETLDAYTEIEEKYVIPSSKVGLLIEKTIDAITIIPGENQNV